MVITYYGEGCFRLQSGETSLLTDPQNNRLKADVVLETLTPVSDEIDSAKISFAGEYEVKGIEIQGLPVPEESTDKFLKTIYAVRFEDIKFLFLGHLSKMPDVKVLEQIDEADVIFIPTGEHFMPAAEAAKLIKQLEPSIIVPSFAKNLDEFLKLLGQKGEQEEKVVFKKKDLGDAKKRVVILKSQ